MSAPNYVIEHMPPDALINHAKALQDERKELTARISELETANKGLQIAMLDANEKEKELQLRNAMLVEKAQAVIDRWETPRWKDADPTATVIYALRDAINATSADRESFIQAEIVKRLGDPVGEKSANGIEWQFANTVHDMPIGNKLYAIPKGD